MNKKEFIERLCMGLKSLPADEAQKTVLFYSEAINDRMEDGMTEEQAVAAMGSISEIVRELCGIEYTESESADKVSAEDDKVTEYTAAESISEIEIRRGMCVNLVHSVDGLIHIKSLTGERFIVSPGGKGEIIVTRADDEIFKGDFQKLRSVHDVVELVSSSLVNALKSFASIDIQLELPEGCDIKLRLGSGSSVRGKGLSFGDISFKASSGDIKVENVKASKVAFTTASGDIKIGELTGEQVVFNSVSGDVEMENSSVSDTIYVRSASGDIELDGVSAKGATTLTTSGDLSLAGGNFNTLSLKSTSGDIDISGTGIKEKLAAATISGDITMEIGEECPLIKLEAVSGNVEAEIAGRYKTEVNSVSGSCRVINSTTGETENRLTANTVSGSIKIVCG